MTTETIIAPIDGQTAVDLLAAAVDLNGADHVYTIPSTAAAGGTCVYVDPHGGGIESPGPSCIVGTALAIHGVPLDVMTDWDESGLAIDSVVGAGRAPFIDEDAADVFQAAQAVQDEAANPLVIHPPTWGDALNAARAKLAEITAAGGAL